MNLCDWSSDVCSSDLPSTDKDSSPNQLSHYRRAMAAPSLSQPPRPNVRHRQVVSCRTRSDQRFRTCRDRPTSYVRDEAREQFRQPTLCWSDLAAAKAASVDPGCLARLFQCVASERFLGLSRKIYDKGKRHWVETAKGLGSGDHIVESIHREHMPHIIQRSTLKDALNDILHVPGKVQIGWIRIPKQIWREIFDTLSPRGVCSRIPHCSGFARLLTFLVHCAPIKLLIV